MKSRKTACRKSLTCVKGLQKDKLPDRSPTRYHVRGKKEIRKSKKEREKEKKRRMKGKVSGLKKER